MWAQTPCSSGKRFFFFVFHYLILIPEILHLLMLFVLYNNYSYFPIQLSDSLLKTFFVCFFVLLNFAYFICGYLFIFLEGWAL